ncbi:tRNA guanosine(34) transglycosylase Tgt [Desulfovibrio inopinatus]|uniref:tRNA guanosine(34) transglycosylase Tgt n=1 Tax=Desulfovibrio inopinatus TaxID=102109 RepID=UPI0004113609|nr:tRNA guanosine(34) transglycosylase Tgt [Desulfovibrio inopinatus]
MSEIGTFTIHTTDGKARRASLTTARGVLETPVFMPVGTAATVKSLAPWELHDAGAQIILGNTYHLYLRPGDERIARLGGLHKFMDWDKPILTDSGGFQVFSLSALRKIESEGVAFQSHIDGSHHFFSPEKVIAIQNNLGSDIMMVLDECVPYGADYDYTAKSLTLTTDWAKRSRLAYPKGSGKQLMFGIVQGGFYPELRRQSAEELKEIDFDGFALGGLSVGESTEEMYAMLAASAPFLPESMPRYLMGVGKPEDILEGVANGIDMFDCVLPTRNARNGTLYTWHGKVNIKRAEFADDESPLDPECSCPCCRRFSRAYLRHLYIARELLSYRLNTIHNVHFFLELMTRTRQAIEEGRFDAFKTEMVSRLSAPYQR